MKTNHQSGVENFNLTKVSVKKVSFLSFHLLGFLTNQSILNWNELQRHFQDTNRSVISLSKLQKFAFSFFLQQYQS